MARWILIDRATGRIFGDSAHFSDETFDTPLEFAQALDTSLGVVGREYAHSGECELPHDEPSGYLCYRAPEEGLGSIPVVREGHTQEVIEAVENACTPAGFIKAWHP
jgi:hypothetical protein